MTRTSLRSPRGETKGKRKGGEKSERTDPPAGSKMVADIGPPPRSDTDMAPHRFQPVLRHIRAVSGGGAADDLPDSLLLDRFARHGDEAAFAALVRRHAPMVLGVCRRLLGDAHAAEDAIQATFLLLVRKARSLRRPDLLGPWLYGVARRTATKARTAAKRRREVATADVPAEPTVTERDARELRLVLDGAIARLPARYRVPVVLCYLQGLTYAQAAEQIGCPPGTVATRLSRAKGRLRILLSRQGVAPATGLLAAALTPDATTAEVSAELGRTTVRFAVAFAAGRTAATLIPTNLLILTRQVGHAMILDKLKVLAVVALGMAGAGAGALVYRTTAAEAPALTEPPANSLAPPMGDGRADTGVAAADKARQGEQVIPLVFLRRQPSNTYLLDEGDILGVFIEGILGERGQAPPVIQAGIFSTTGSNRAPVIGFPISVQEGGTLSLPLIGPRRVRGKSITEVQEEIQNVCQQARLMQPGGRVMVTLAQPRTYRVTVLRSEIAGSPDNARRTTGTTLELPAYENDVLNALVRSGGLPGRSANATIVIQRGSAAPSTADTTVAAATAGVQQIRIPLRLRPDAKLPFRPDDILLKNGDVVLVESGDAELGPTASAAAEPARPWGMPVTALAVAAPDGRVLVQMPGTGAADSWRLVSTAQLQALETDGQPINGKALADRLKTMTTVLLAPGGRKPDALYLQAIKPGTPVLILQGTDR
jgi:RNA polymerase sigma factor (sigma-70 family)